MIEDVGIEENFYFPFDRYFEFFIEFVCIYVYNFLLLSSLYCD